MISLLLFGAIASAQVTDWEIISIDRAGRYYSCAERRFSDGFDLRCVPIKKSGKHFKIKKVKGSKAPKRHSEII